MGGKSKALVLVGLCQWCAQHALPVPAEAFDFKPLHHLVYVGSEQPQQTDEFQGSGLSAFAREIRRIVRGLDHSAPTGWLLDEIGRGTHPGDGADLLIDLLARLADDGHRALAASHFPALAALEDVQHLQIRGLSPDVDLARIFDDATDIDRALRRALDHQPHEVATGSVPRDARRVAGALGLEIPRLSDHSNRTDTEATMPDNAETDFESKSQARDWVWTELRQRGAARFPFPIRQRIPNFEGAERCAERLFKETPLDEASAIKTNPDSPQKHIRRIALELGITVYVPTPRLKGGFMCFDPDTIDAQDYRDASMLSRWDPHKQQVPLEEMPQLDAIVTGCVAVTEKGKRCGKGEGYSDLEYAILGELGHEPAPVYTTVHSIQVVSDFPTESHDLTLTGIATPDRWIDTGAPRADSAAIDWSQLTDDDLEEMPILKQLAPE
jgi:5-formyltetrahydrofolate cyclo-ligase